MPGGEQIVAERSAGAENDFGVGWGRRNVNWFLMKIERDSSQAP